MTTYSTMIFTRVRSAMIVTLSLLLMLGGILMPGSAHAAGADFYITPASTSVQRGTDVTVSFRVNPDGESVNAVTIDATYNASVLQPKGGITLGYFGSGTSSAASGAIRIDAGTSTPATSDVLVGTLTFSTIANGTAQISLTSSTIAADGFTDVTGGLSNASITVTEPPAPDPDPDPDPDPTPDPTPDPDPDPTTDPGSGSGNNGAGAGDTTKPEIVSTTVEGEATAEPAVVVVVNETSTGVLKYGFDAETLVFNVGSTEPSAEHRFSIPSDDIPANAVVYYQVVVTDSAGNETLGDVSNFTYSNPDAVTEASILTVTVTDEDGNPVEGAVVVFGNQEVRTNANGQAALNVLESGTFEVTVTVDGQTTTQEVEVDVNESANVLGVTVQRQVAEEPEEDGNVGLIIGVAGGLVVLAGGGFAFWKWGLPNLRKPGGGASAGGGSSTKGSAKAAGKDVAAATSGKTLEELEKMYRKKPRKPETKSHHKKHTNHSQRHAEQPRRPRVDTGPTVIRPS